jgi:hypothetical protein
MRNLGSQDERMAVRFPISASNGRAEYPELTHLVIKVNGHRVASRRATYPDPRDARQDVSWSEFDVTFPSRTDVKVEVMYDLKGSGYAPYTAYYYVLGTGAGWKDTIGSADIILRLPYPANVDNVVLDTQIGWAQTTAGGMFQEHGMVWHFENFEPGPQGVVDNMEFTLVSPAAWQVVLKERANVAMADGDGEAWGRLARAYKAIFFLNKGYRTDAGGDELYTLSRQAYEECLRLLSADAQWHAGLADLLASRSYWDFSGHGATRDTVRALDEIRTALKLAPNDTKVRQIAQQISGMFPDAMPRTESGYAFTWLTETPTARAAVEMTATPAPLPGQPSAASESSSPRSAGGATPAPTSGHAAPPCGSVALVPLAAAYWVVRKRKQEGAFLHSRQRRHCAGGRK